MEPTINITRAVNNHHQHNYLLIFVYLTGPAPDAVTNEIYLGTTSITKYSTTDPPIVCDLSQIGKHTFFVDGGRQFVVEVIDPVADYLALMQDIFDFPSIKALLSGSADKPAFQLLLNAMHGGRHPSCYEDILICINF